MSNSINNLKTRVVTGFCGITVILTGVLVLIGWQFDIRMFTTVLPGYVGMNPLTALCFVLAGLSLWLQGNVPSMRRNPGRWIVVSFASFAMLVGIVCLAGYFFNLEIGLDQWLFQSRLEQVGSPWHNRVAPNTALALLFSGTALMIEGLGVIRSRRLSEGLIVATLFISLLVLIGYAFGVSQLYGVRLFIPMALHTALAFMILGVGILYLRPDVGMMGLLTGPTEGGAVARRLLPFVIGVPLFFCWMRIVGVKAGWFSVEMGLSLVAVTTMLVFAVVVVWNALAINRKEEERRRLEEKLLQMGYIVDASDDAIIGKTLDGTVLSWNKGAEKMYGYSEEEIKGRPISLLIPPGHADELPKLLEKIKCGEHINHYDTIRIRKNGSLIDVSLSIAPIKDLNGTIVGASVVARDITERKQAEVALRESEERYHILFDSIDEGFCIIEMIFDEHEKPVDYRFLQVNPSFEKQTGLKDAQGKRMRELAPQHERYWFEIYGNIALTGQPARFENRAEQLHRWYDVYAFRFGEPENRQVAVLFNDITERKKVEETVRQKSLELEHSNKELEAFSYSVSHDLRAPLRAIEGFSRIIEEDYSKQLDAEGKRLFGVVRTNTRQMGQLIDDLLAFSRLSRKGVEKAEIDVTSMARHVLEEQMQTYSGERRPQLEMGQLPVAHGDAAMIQQVWINLISNALKFTRKQEKPRIEIRGWTEGSEIIYCVKDNGVGFDMSYVNKLFGVFQRLHRADEFEGTGVGLAIVQRIVHRHGGRVWAEAKINEGAAFFFTLPATMEKS